MLEWVVVERVNPCIRPLLPRVLIVSLATMDAAVGLEPRLEGMNLVSYLLLHHCDIIRAQFTLIIFQKISVMYNCC